MNTRADRTYAWALVLIGSLGALAAAQEPSLDWWTIDSGGAMWTTGGGFELSGTVGQPDASTTVMSGGGFSLTGGFWPAAEAGPLKGDMDCDGDISFDDINPFVRALVGEAVYEARHPDCRWLNGDIDGDGDVNFDDISPFVKCLVHNGCP